MNRLAWMSAVAVVTSMGFVSLPGGMAMAQTPGAEGGAAGSTAPAAPAPVPDEARKGTAPENFRAQIEGFVKGHISRLTSGDSKAASSSRDALIGEVTSPTTSAAYKDFYAGILAAQVQPVFGNANAMVRFQGAVIVARVAGATGNSALAPIAVKLLGDQNVAVQLYGLKTAKAVIANQIVLPNGLAGSPLPKAVANTLIANIDKPEIVRDAVDALYLDLDRATRLTGSARAAALKELVPEALRILAARAKGYEKGLPEEAESDRTVLTFFSNIAWGTLTAPQRQEAMQRFFDILLQSARASVNAQGPEGRPVALNTIQVGRAIYIIASSMDTAGSNAGTKAFLNAAQFFRSASDTLPPAGSELNARANALFDAARGIAEFGRLQAPTGGNSTAPSK